MSGLGQKATLICTCTTCAPPPTADIDDQPGLSNVSKAAKERLAAPFGGKSSAASRSHLRTVSTSSGTPARSRSPAISVGLSLRPALESYAYAATAIPITSLSRLSRSRAQSLVQLRRRVAVIAMRQSSFRALANRDNWRYLFTTCQCTNSGALPKDNANSSSVQCAIFDQ